MKRFSTILLLTVGLVTIGAGCGLTTTIRIPKDSASTVTLNTPTTEVISYPGQDGKNALELLQQNHAVDVSAEGFVNAIDGRQPGDHQFWAFYVNGQSATVGAIDYQAKNNDTIDWKLESY
jgi:hypothetical protein